VLHACMLDCQWENLCLDSIDGSWCGILVEALVLLYSFAAVAIIADSHLVPALETLCVRWGVREDVAGASFMAFGSAAPEIVINTISTLKAVVARQHGNELNNSDDTAMGIGAIIGSGMIAFTAIPGACSVCASETLLLKRRPLARDVGFYALALAVLCGAMSDGAVETHEAATMVLLYACYLVLVTISSRVRQLYRIRYLGRAQPAQQQSFVLQTHGVAPLAALPPQNQEPVTDRGIQMSQQSPQRQDPEPGGQSARSPFTTGVAPTPRWPVRLLHIACKLASSAAHVATRPLLLLFGRICPECSHDSPHAHRYPVTLAVAFGLIAALSTIISAVVARWGVLLQIPGSFLGMYVIAVGAEIPDTIQSVAVARRGYGSMAVSNSTGSQIINILIGLGLPWLICCTAGLPVAVRGHESIRVMALFQAANVSLYTLLLLLATACTWRRGDHSKARLDRRKGLILMLAYVVALSSYAAFVFTSK